MDSLQRSCAFHLIPPENKTLNAIQDHMEDQHESEVGGKGLSRRAWLDLP